MPALVKFLHVAMAMWFIAGLLGRTLAMWQASRAGNVKTVQALVRLAGIFERLMVIPGSFAVLGFGLLAAWLQRWPLLGTLQGSPSNWLLLSTVLYLSMVPLVKWVFLPRARVFEQALAAAVAAGTVTPSLSAAFRDRVVGMAHVYEIAATAIVTLLMVTKPF